MTTSDMGYRRLNNMTVLDVKRIARCHYQSIVLTENKEEGAFAVEFVKKLYFWNIFKKRERRAFVNHLLLRRPLGIRIVFHDNKGKVL